MSDTWTIGELAEHAARALRDGAPPPANGRVRDVPGERLIRWYTTIGLVDPPLTRRGRIARYGRRHLLQLVAVKRLQAAGRSIAEIQTALAGATDRMLESAANLAHPPDPKTATFLDDSSPAGPPPDSATLGNAPSGNTSLDVASRDAASRNGASHGNASSGNAAQDSVSLEAASLDGASLENGSVDAGYPDGASLDNASSDAGSLHGVSREGGTVEGALLGDGGRAGRGRFWVERPDAAGVTARERAAGTPSPAKAARREGDGRRVVTGVRLGGGARLVLDAGRVPSEEDVQAVLAAAGPLLAVLEERNLI
ncbi:helix-turn-helix domain-containing protein [Nonomuraea fuscirosea]|uniref:helix-turn-helix domain-containing protein n=1 Tax=Nonomuraea fuscirosea TaxID=1291556 RepID=UPI002DDBED14|nr:helix-turn-helix domain-containing protein [Nonomuraea fuscirosea]WSA48079.1 helix-turn-helix domain-containing protein [Nonomuraea fuscirosea]